MKNNFEFTLVDFPNDNFEFENNIFSGKATLKQNGVLVEQSTEKGKPFLIKRVNGEIVKAFPKANIPDISSRALDINDKKYPMAKKLKWYEYVIGALPLLLLFGGGALGGLFGGGATVMNYSIFRTNTSTANKYVKVLGINFLSILFYIILSGLFYSLFN